MAKSGLIRLDGNPMTHSLFLQKVGCVVTLRALVLVRFDPAREIKNTLYGGGSPRQLVCQLASTNRFSKTACLSGGFDESPEQLVCQVASTNRFSKTACLSGGFDEQPS